MIGNDIVQLIEDLIELKLQEVGVEDHNGPALAVEISQKKKELASYINIYLENTE